MSDSEVIYTQNWKSKDELSIFEGHDYFRVITHLKDKHSGSVTEQSKYIKKNNVFELWNILLDNEIGFQVEARYLWKKLIIRNGIADKENTTVEMMCECYNGGKFRGKYYFQDYYFPLVILESLGLVSYSSKGSVIRLSDKLRW